MYTVLTYFIKLNIFVIVGSKFASCSVSTMTVFNVMACEHTSVAVCGVATPASTCNNTAENSLLLSEIRYGIVGFNIPLDTL